MQVELCVQKHFAEALFTGAVAHMHKWWFIGLGIFPTVCSTSHPPPPPPTHISSVHLPRSKMWSAEADKGFGCVEPPGRMRGQICTQRNRGGYTGHHQLLHHVQEVWFFSKTSPGFVEVPDKAFAGEAGKCLNSCSYCCQALLCPLTGAEHTYSKATVHLMGSYNSMYPFLVNSTVYKGF